MQCPDCGCLAPRVEGMNQFQVILHLSHLHLRQVQASFHPPPFAKHPLGTPAGRWDLEIPADGKGGDSNDSKQCWKNEVVCNGWDDAK